jgi:S-methylmethionine-dependent homocysteine/selenocysteine methylase
MEEKRHPIVERVSRGQCVVLDGGIADELARRGYRPTGPLQDAAAAREAPDLLAAIHRAYIDAGADVVTAFTARTTVRALARGGLGMRAASLTHRAVDLAMEAAQQAGRPVAVAGTLSTLEDPSRPEHRLSPRSLADEHGDQAIRLESTGCNLILVEPMPTVIESLAATAAARTVMASVWSVLAVSERGHLADGTAIETAAREIAAVGAQAVLLEGRSIADVVHAVGVVAGLALGVPIGARGGVDAAARPPVDRYATDLAVALARGARILGGGAGSSPDEVRALADRVRARAAA